MRVDCYESTKFKLQTKSKFLTVRAGDDVALAQAMVDDEDLKSLKPYHLDWEIDPSLPFIGFDTAQIVRQIEDKGYATHGVEVIVQVATSSPSRPA